VTSDARAALLAELVDYAGLFPPAALPLAEALARYDRHLTGGDAAQLGRFILPANQRDALAPWLGRTWHDQRPLRLSVLAGPDDVTPLAAWAQDEPSVRLEALELKPPLEVSVAVWLDGLLGALAAADLLAVEVFVELPPGRDRQVLADLARRQADQPLRRLGAKLRCGGVTADLVPPVARIATVLADARDGAVPLKFTAGLHHPVRGMDHTEGVPMHGFLNVYGAALLAHADELTATDLEPLLAETDAGAFRLGCEGFAWRERLVPAADVADLRRRLLGGFGSCSFREPLDDLRALGMLT
jgi:hypothetical protein